MIEQEEPLWLGVRDAAAMLGIHRNTLKKIDPGDLPYMQVTLRGDRRYAVLDINAYIENRMVWRRRR